MSSSLPLLVFAHQGEGQIFIKKDRLSRSLEIPIYYNDNGNYHLLITGGGGEKTLEAVTRVLATKNIRVSEIINLGIAGSLNEEIKLHEVYTISTVYAYREGKPVHESFSLMPPQPRTTKIRDCLTVSSPVNHARTRLRLSAFADVIDMELWWVAYAAKNFSLPVRGVKIISDHAHNLPSKSIPSRSEFYSQTLYNWYEQNCIHNKNNLRKPLSDYIGNPNKIEERVIRSLQLSHITVSQRRILTSLLNQMIKKYPKKNWEVNPDNIWDTLKVPSLDRNKYSSKELTAKVIGILRETLHPVSEGYHRKLRNLTNPTIGKGVEVEYDNQLESSNLKISFTTKSLEDWKTKMKALESLPAEDIFSLLQGKKGIP